MENFCSYEIRVKGSKNACLLVSESMPYQENNDLDLKRLESGRYYLAFNGSCKQSVIFGVTDTTTAFDLSSWSKGKIVDEEKNYKACSLRAKSEELQCEILLHYWSEVSGFDCFEHYKNGRILTQRKIAYDDDNEFDWDSCEFVGHEGEYDDGLNEDDDGKTVYDRSARSGQKLNNLLWSAIETGDCQQANVLLEAGADVNYIEETDREKVPLLINAIRTENVGMVKLLLANDADPNCERVSVDNSIRLSALFDSIYSWPNDEIAEMLIESGADVDYVAQDNDIKDPILISAIMKSNVKMVRLLLANDADPDCEVVNVEEGFRFSALYCSINQWPNGEIAEALIESGANVDYIAQGSGVRNPVLISAIMKRNVKMVHLLLANGADPDCEIVNAEDRIRFSALYSSIERWPNDEIAEMLIANGADVDYIASIDGSRNSILIGAIMKGNVKMVELLLENGVDPNYEAVTEDISFNALSANIIKWPNNKITTLLIEGGADVNCSTQSNDTSFPMLVLAIAKGNVGLVRLLLSNDADPDCERIRSNGDHYSALFDSIYTWPNDEIAKMLIAAGADVDYSAWVNGVSMPVLISAIMKGNVRMVRFLLSKGADPSCERVLANGDCCSALCDSIVEWPNSEITMLLAKKLRENHEM